LLEGVTYNTNGDDRDMNTLIVASNGVETAMRSNYVLLTISVEVGRDQIGTRGGTNSDDSISKLPLLQL